MSNGNQTGRTTTKLVLVKVGGTVCTPNGAICVMIPPGALAQDIKISLTIAGPEMTIPAVTQLFPGAQLEPDGLGFIFPATAIAKLQADSISGVSLLLADASGQYEELSGIERNEGAKTVSGKLNHFSWLYPYLVSTSGTATPPSVQLNGGSSGPIFGEVGNGQTGQVGLRVELGTTGLVWTNSAGSSEILSIQLNFPSQVAGQTGFATVTVEDPGPYTGHGQNAQQEWKLHVFNRIFMHMMSTPGHPSGADGIAVHPIMVNSIPWDQLPVGYPSGMAIIEINYFDQNAQQIGASTLILSISRPNL